MVKIYESDEELLDFIFKFQNLSIQVGALLVCDTGSHHWSFNSTGPSQYCLWWHKTVLNVLLLTTRRQSHYDLQWVTVSGQYEYFHLAFGDLLEHFIDAFSDLFEGQQLLDQFAYLFGQFGIGQRFGFEQFLLNGTFVLRLVFCRLEQVDELLFFLAHWLDLSKKEVKVKLKQTTIIKSQFSELMIYYKLL